MIDCGPWVEAIYHETTPQKQRPNKQASKGGSKYAYPGVSVEIYPIVAHAEFFIKWSMGE